MSTEKAGSARRFIASVVAVAGLVLGLAVPAQADPTNLVTNGGFETGDFTGWTGTGDQTFNGVQCPGASAPEGNCDAFFGPIGTTGGIEQIINVGGPGLRYHLYFFLDTDGGTPSSFSVAFGGDTLFSLTNPPNTPFIQYHFGGITTGASETLTFLFRDDPGFMFLDGVQLVIPEPETLGLLGAGLIGLFLSRRRRAA